MYENEFGMLGGEFYGVLIGDYEIMNYFEDIDLILKMLGVVVVVYVFFIILLVLDLFGFEWWMEMVKFCDFEKIFDF